MKAETRPSSCPGHFYHLLLFRTELWWFCCLVLTSESYPDPVGPSPPMAGGWNQIFNTSSNPNHSMILPHKGTLWRTFSQLLRHPLYRNPPLEMLFLQVIKAYWILTQDPLWQYYHCWINEGRLFSNNLKGGTVKQKRWSAFTAVGCLKATPCFALSLGKEGKTNSLKSQHGTRDLGQETPQI